MGSPIENTACGNENKERKNFKTSKNKSETFDIFPNPNTGNFTVLFNYEIDQTQKVEIKVYDFLGRIENHYTVSGNNDKFSLSLDGNLKGTYFVEMIIDSKSFGTKMVIILNYKLNSL